VRLVAEGAAWQPAGEEERDREGSGDEGARAQCPQFAAAIRCRLCDAPVTAPARSSRRAISVSDFCVLQLGQLALAAPNTSAILVPIAMTLTVECVKEFEGRWFAEVPQLPGVHAYGSTRDAAAEQALAMVYRMLENARQLGVPRVDTADIYGRQTERPLPVAAPGAALS